MIFDKIKNGRSIKSQLNICQKAIGAATNRDSRVCRETAKGLSFFGEKEMFHLE